MNNVFVYCEIEGTTVADVSLELLTKGRKLASQLGCQLEAIIAGSGPITLNLADDLTRYGVRNILLCHDPQSGLELLERNCSRYNKTMFYTRKAAFLIAAGRLNDAAAALDQAESSPLCAQCVYPECKDAAALRALLLEQKGQLKEAAELCRTWGTRYPDEVDFRDWEKRIRKKMGKTR